MATFVVLISFTEQGVKNFRQTPQRAEAFRQMAQKAGVTVKDLYWTLGAFDGVLVLEAPDDESATALLLSLGALGNVRTQTLRAFDRSQIESILDKAQ